MSVQPLFRTPVEIPAPPRQIGVGDKSVFLGSCFAEHVGACFTDARFRSLVNPLGVQYNPLSVVRLLTTPQSDARRHFISHGDFWHTWLGDSSLSRPTLDECRQATDAALATLHGALAEADHLFLTLGTSRYYIYSPTSETVANCHRLPSQNFVETDLCVDEIIHSLESALFSLRRRNPRVQVVFTVSPFRYQKYGFHESQLSKSRLLLAVDELQRRHADWVAYFPAYEIVMDELRDYRFYADDMLHPSESAVRYIWQRLCEIRKAPDAQAYLRRWEPLRRALLHRPLHPESPACRQFQADTCRQLAQLKADYPALNFEL